MTFHTEFSDVFGNSIHVNVNTVIWNFLVILIFGIVQKVSKIWISCHDVQSNSTL